MASDLTGYGTSACVDCAACRERDAEIERRDGWRIRAEVAEAEVERLRDELAAYKADDDESIALQVAQIARLSAEVERLTAQLDAVREAWGNRSDLSWHSAFVEGVKALRPEHAAQMDAALGGDA